MKQYKHIFGPVPSRRLGRSLGIDLIPYKTCSLNCIFCQLGCTNQQTIKRSEYVPVGDVLEEIAAWLETDGNADYITLSGSGEPTLHSRFGEIIEWIHQKTSIPVVLLTNGTTLYLPEVRDAACKANLIKISLSAWDEDSFEQVNRPYQKLRFAQLVEGEKSLRTQFSGELWLEVFILRGINSLKADVKKIAELAKQIAPDRIHLNTAVRPPAEKFAVPVSTEQLETLAELFDPRAEVIAEFSNDQSPEVQANENTILSMIQRRPCTAMQIAEVFGMHANEVSKYIGKLIRTGQIRADHKKGDIYYLDNNCSDV